jgi:HEAT repeat protein
MSRKPDRAAVERGDDMQVVRDDTRRKGHSKRAASPSAEWRDPDHVVHDLVSNDLDVRVQAQEALVLEGTRAVPPLLRALATGGAHLRAAAVQTLSAIGDPLTAPSLARALDDDDGAVRWEAGEGLIALGRPGVSAAVHTLVTHELPSPQLKDAVRHVLLGMRLDQEYRVLTPLRHALANHEPDEVLMVRAYEASAKLTNQD